VAACQAGLLAAGLDLGAQNLPGAMVCEKLVCQVGSESYDLN